MTRLQIFVALESVVLVVLGVLWWSRATTAEIDLVPSPPLPHAELAAASVTPHAGSAAQIDRRELVAESAAPELDPVFQSCVAGTVQNERGEPIAEARISFVRGVRLEGGISGTNGAYVIGGLAAGAWDVSVHADGYIPHYESRALEGRPWQRVDLALRPWTAVPVRFVDREGRPMSRASLSEDLRSLEIVATEEPLSADLRPGEARSSFGFGLGRWFRVSDGRGPEIDQLVAAGYAGELQLHREPPVVATLLYQHLRIAEQRVELGQKELAFAIDPAELAAKRGRVRLRVLDAATSAPLAGLAVLASTGNGGHRSAVTDAEGRLVLHDVLPGIARLSVLEPEREPLELHVRVPVGAEVDAGDLRLGPRASLKGRVLRPDGSPAPGVSISWCAVDARSWPAPLDTGISTSSDPKGRFELPVGKQRYLVYARGRKGERAHGLADNADPSFREIVLRLETATRVNLRYDERACAGCLLVLETAEGWPAVQLTLDGSRRNRSAELPPGRYVAKVLDAYDAQVSSRPFEVAGETQELVLP